MVHAFPAGNAYPPITPIYLAPLPDSGFSANRVSPNNFCNTVPPAQSNIFCPNPAILQTLQRQPPRYPQPTPVGGDSREPAVCDGHWPAAEPPEIFNVNVQALVYAVDTKALAEVAVGEKFKNLNVQIAKEAAAPPPSLDKTFANDIVDIDADGAGHTFLIVSRGGNQLFRAHLVDPATGQLNILNTAGDKVACRLQTGNLPSGVAMSEDGSRAYANNEANFSVTSVNIDDCSTLQLDIASSTPAPGIEHAVLVGKVAFFTALGIPDNNFLGTDIRDIIPRNFRGKQSRDAWSSCGSCHPDGLADGVTWIFGTGPPDQAAGRHVQQVHQHGRPRAAQLERHSRQQHRLQQQLPCYSGGCGFASVVATGGWIPRPSVTPGSRHAAQPDAGEPGHLRPRHHARGQRRPRRADPVDLCRRAGAASAATERCGGAGRGRDVFAANCASCHGGAKWTKSQIFHRDNPAAMQNGPTLDPGVTRLAPAPPVAAVPANEFFSFTCNALTINYLEDVGTFDDTEPLEIRDNARCSLAFGRNGFNVPSLLSINYHAPYLHRGQAQTLEEVFPLHGLGPRGRGSADHHDCDGTDGAPAGGSPGIPSDRWHHRSRPLRGGRLSGCPEAARPLSSARPNDVVSNTPEAMSA